MKITIFGATGKTGPYLIKEALNRGMEITVFARSSSSFDYPGVRIIKGELTDTKLLTEAIHGADAIVSALGPTKTNHPSNLPITEAYKAIIPVMERESVKRLIATSTPTAPDPGDKKFVFSVWFPALMIKLLLPSSYREMITFPKIIRKSNLDWTMVRLNLLKDRPGTKKINLGLCGRTEHTLTVSREDVAIFMLDQIQSNKFIHQAPAISNK